MSHWMMLQESAENYLLHRHSVVADNRNRGSLREVILIACESHWLSMHTIIYYIYCIINGCAL